FLVAIDRSDKVYALAYMDLSTGEFKTTQLKDFSSLVSQVSMLKSRELVAGYDLSQEESQVFQKQMNLLISREDEQADSALISNDLNALEKQVSAKLLAYVQVTQKRELSHLQPVLHYEIKDYLQMDFATMSSLELTANKREGKKHGTLYGLLDATKTAMGTRLLKSWIERPLISEEAIQKRADIVELLMGQFFERTDLIEALKGVYDLERLASRVSFGRAVPVDFLQLSNSLSHVPAIKNVLYAMNSPLLSHLIEGLDEIPELSQLIHSAIDENAQRIITEGDIIKSGYHAQLDKYREALSSGTSWITELEAKEKENSGISNLRIDYNRKDGYYFHVTASNLNDVPEHFFRKATLKNSERFGTKELSEIEETMLEAREQSTTLEYELFIEIRNAVGQFIGRLQALAKIVAEIDCLQSLATVAEKHQYIRPTLTENSHKIDIVKGRHAVVEAIMGAQEYVPNDIDLDEKTSIQLITGPNMSGKSTYMRQLALLVIMAQLGSFVPAEKAELPVFDAIFTRIGASDNLISGESTFMVEMMEANHAIQNATDKSLIIFDELGRGTATYDGMALAQSIIEYIHDKTDAKTLFATHYHELTALENTLSKVSNVHVATLEKDGDVTFLHKITAGPADKSYGIHVAKIAGLPKELLIRAGIILEQLENGDNRPNLQQVVKEKESHANEQVNLFEDSYQPLVNELSTLNVNQLTPMEALQILDKLKGMI
ncbi:MAG: DNA mismatch repair protein MutS, partial [Streptococcaceae bacterium]|nr:DNA mismatch repair protein MutS [Streptococcaceae bacterium]